MLVVGALLAIRYLFANLFIIVTLLAAVFTLDIEPATVLMLLALDTAEFILLALLTALLMLMRCYALR